MMTGGNLNTRRRDEKHDRNRNRQVVDWISAAEDRD